MATAPNPKPHPKEVAIKAITQALELSKSELSKAQLTHLRLKDKPEYSEMEIAMFEEKCTIHQEDVESLQAALSWVKIKPAFQ